MKRICILLLFSLALIAGLQAQTILVYGYVTDNNGVGQANYAVTITGVGGINYISTNLTGTNGYFSDSVVVNTTQGGFEASIVDCNQNTQTARGGFTPMTNSVGPLNLNSCPSSAGNCQAAFSFSVTGGANNIFQFTDNSTPSNPFLAINSWSWSFGDGTTSTAQNPMHTYSMNGSYTVCLTITDASGCTDSTCQTITVGSAQPCQAAFGFQVSPNGSVSFVNGSRGGVAPFTYLWRFGDGNTATTANALHTYAAAGTYTACLWVTDANGCVDSTCQPVIIAASSPCTASFSFLPSGLGVQFSDASTGLGPAAVNTYSWDFGDGNTSTAQNPLHTYAASGTYTVCLIFTSSGMGVTCSDTSCATITLQGTGNRGFVSGQVFKNQVGADSVKVWLIVHDPMAGTLTAVDSTMTITTALGSGYYTFGNLAPGSYRTKAALIAGDPDYANYLPTYHDNDLMWNNASVITVTANGSVIADINMVAGTNPGGPGFIGGLISQGANKRDPGDPLEDVNIYLLDNNDNAVAYVLTDSKGEYGFSNLAYGTYRVHVEVLGKNYTDQYITISSASSAATNINFTVGSTDIDVTTAINEPTFGKLMSLYPNPTSGELYIELSLDKAVSLQVQVMDVLGRSQFVQQEQLLAGDQKLKLNLNNLSRGVYFLNLRVDNQVISHKVVVE